MAFNRSWETVSEFPSGTMLRPSEFVCTYVRAKSSKPLTESQVKAIRAEKVPETEKHRWYEAMGIKYGCCWQTIRNIVLGVTHRRANKKWLARQKERNAQARG